MIINSGSKVVRINPQTSGAVLELIREFHSGRTLKARVRNEATGAEFSLRRSEIRLATPKEKEIGCRVDEKFMPGKPEFMQWFAEQSFYQSFAHNLAERLFDSDTINGEIVFRNPHLDAVWKVWASGEEKQNTINQLNKRISAAESKIGMISAYSNPEELRILRAVECALRGDDED